jgi:hypothetical protein
MNARNLVIDDDLLQLMGLTNQNEIIQPRRDYDGMTVKEIIL